MTKCEVNLVLDSGALIALERGDKVMWKRFGLAILGGDAPKTHAGVLGQVWRDGARQARLAQALSSVKIYPLDARLGRAAGEILALSGKSDVIDAALVLLAEDGDEIYTSDSDDIRLIAEATKRQVEVIPI